MILENETQIEKLRKEVHILKANKMEEQNEAIQLAKDVATLIDDNTNLKLENKHLKSKVIKLERLMYGSVGVNTQKVQVSSYSKLPTNQKPTSKKRKRSSGSLTRGQHTSSCPKFKVPHHK